MKTSFIAKKIFVSGIGYHCLDGPAIVYENGDESYYVNGALHRLEGPAVNWFHNPEWFINGKLINVNSQEEFERYLKLKAFW